MKPLSGRHRFLYPAAGHERINERSLQIRPDPWVVIAAGLRARDGATQVKHRLVVLPGQFGEHCPGRMDEQRGRLIGSPQVRQGSLDRALLPGDGQQPCPEGKQELGRFVADSQ
jgi:hypothetical protein